MADLEIMSPIAQSILQWDKACQEESVDNFDLGLSLNGQENGDSYMDHTFHTPSFGDEEFDIPPINLPPTTPGSDTNSSDVYGSTQPLSHQEQPTQQQTNNNNQQQQQQQQHQHMMPSPQQQQQQQQQMSPCSQTLDRIGPVMTTTTAPPSPSMMTSFSTQQHHMQHLQQQPQMQQYGQQHQNDMYMLHIAQPGSMMPPQSVQFHVQQYALPYQQQQQHPPMQQQPHHVQHPHHMLLPPSPMMARQRGSPPNSNHTSPGLETSEDSDDSGHLSQLLCGGVKRPSPSPPVERPPSVGKPVKKPKVQKKKKKRDPNEPQKPVSAYALFFRDTQAAIKGQNPNASFGEVSKIVASMWDGLDIDHKNVYKKKTEAAKKEYLKALAAYRASLVSKAANEQSDSLYGGASPPGLSPLQKKSPLLTSLMEGSPQQNMTNQQSLIMAQQNGGGLGQHQHMGHPPSHQMLHQMLSSPQQHMMQQHMGHSPPPTQQQQQQHMMQQHHNMHLVNNNNIPYTHNMQQSPQQLPHPGQQQGMMQLQPQNNCPRPDSQQQQQQDWERDYCNNDCVVSHCRDVFTTWVAARPPQTSYASVK